METNYNLLKDAYSIKNVSTCQYDSLHGYVSDFSRNGDVDGWDIYSNICLYGVWDTVLFGTSLGRECYISRTNIFVPIPAEEYHIMKVTMKLTLPDDLPEQFYPTKGRLMWQTVADPSWNEEKTIDFDLNVDDQWYSYIINTGESQYWQGDINNVRIYPFIDGKPDIRFTIKTINIDSTNFFQCTNTQCSYYSKYSHPCKGIGKRASITSGVPTEIFTTVSGVNDKLVLNIDDYGDQQINLGNFTNITGSDMAKVLVNRISLVDIGQYAYVESTFDYTQNKLVIHSGTPTDSGLITIGGPAAKVLGFVDELDEDVSTKTIGESPASGFDYSASRRLKGFEINALIDSDKEHTAYYHNPNQYTVEAGRSDFVDSMSSSHDPRPIDVDYYKEIDGNNKLIIDGSHPVNDSGRLTMVKINGSRCKDVDDNMFTSSRFSSSFSKVVLLRPYRVDDIENSSVRIIYEAVIEDPEKGAVHTSDDVTYSVPVDWLVNKGDLIGFYNFNVLCPYSQHQRVPNAVYFEVSGLPEGKFSIGKPAAKGVIGLSFYAKSSRIQENIQLEIDLGRRINIEDLFVHGKELKTTYEYNVAACLDVTWQVDLHNDTHWHSVGHCYAGVVGRKVEHRNKAYGLECLDDCITTPDNGQQGDSYTSNPMGGSLHYDGTVWIQNDDPDTYSGLTTIGEHCYFYVNGDGEWNNTGCITTTDPDSAWHTMEFKYPWDAGDPYDYEFDPVTFTLLFPPGRVVPIHKSAIYFKESDNFKHLSLSYYLGEFGENGDAEEIHWKYVPKFNSVDLDGTMLYEGLSDGARRNEKYDDIYFSNPWPWAKPEYVNGKCTNWDIYQTMMNERMNTLGHYFDPIECYGFRYHNEWHKSTKITEIEVFSSLSIEPSLLDNVSMYSSIYGTEWHELSFIADEDNDEKIIAHSPGSPRYFKLEIKSQDIFKLKELNAAISTEHMKDLECYNTINADIAPKGIMTASKELTIENTYDVPLNLIVDIPTDLFKQQDILSWIRFDSEDSTINAEIGPGAIVRKNPDYPLVMSRGQVANNCVAYYLKNMIENSPSYQFVNNYKWAPYKILHHNEDVAYINEPIGQQYLASFDKVSSKYWKLGVFDIGNYKLNSFKLYNGLSLLDNYDIYIQARPDFFSGKFKTSIDPITGNILPADLVMDDFSNSTYLDYWDHNFSLNPGNNNLVEAQGCILPYLDGWGMVSISKTFWPGAISFDMDIHFRFDLPNSLKYTVELLDEDGRVLFTMELVGQESGTAILDIWATYPVEQEMKHLQHWGTDPMLYAGGQVITGLGSRGLIFSVEKVGNVFSYISLDTDDGTNVFNITDKTSFPDRVNSLCIRYENMSSDEYYSQTTKVSTSNVSVRALPYLSAQEFIAFDFPNSEPVDKFEVVHTQSALVKPAILISNLDNDDYIFWAQNFAKTGDLTPISLSIYSDNSFFNSGNNLLDSSPWNLFSDDWSFYFSEHSCFVKYDFGAGNAKAINYLYYTPYANTSYQTPDIVQVYGTNEYGDTFDPESPSNRLLIEFVINKYGTSNAFNEEYFTNNNYYRFLIIYWPRKEDNTWNTLLLSKKMRFGRVFDEYNPYNSIPSEQEVLLIHSDNEEGDTGIEDSSYYLHPLHRGGTLTHSTSASKFGNSSIYFNGSTQYIMVGDDTPTSEAYFDFADNDFTIDVWIYMTTHGAHRRICSTRSVASGGTGMIVTVHIDGTFYFQDTTAGVVYSSHYVPLNQWNHIAVVGHEDTIKLYLNGIADTATLVQGTLSPPDTRFTVGRIYDQGAYAFYGFMDAFRVNNGVALWTEDFTPPEFIKSFENSMLTTTEENYINYLAVDLQQLHNVDFLRNSGPSEDLHNIWNTSEVDYSASDTANIDEVEWKGSAPVLLLNFENFTDSSNSEHVLVREGDVSISTIDSPVAPNGHVMFNGGTISIDTSGDFNLGTDEFTIDFRVLRSSAGYEGVITRKSSLNSTSSFSFTFGTDNYLVATLYSGGSLFELKSQFVFSPSTWYHVALVRFNGTLGLYINGEVQNSIYIGLTVEINASTASLILGSLDEAYFTGSLDELRIIKGNAYWKHSFDPPEVAYTNTTVGDKTNARWFKVPMLCGDNIERHLQYIGVYPDITMAYMPSGGYNCDWIPFEAPDRLTNYSIGARNLAPYSEVLNIAQTYYEFESSGLAGWDNLTYPVVIASGIEQTDFSGEFLDPIWEAYTEEFTDLYSSITHEDKALKIFLTVDEDSTCSFRTKDVSGPCSFEVEIDHSINHIQTNRLTTGLHIYNADRSHTMYLKRELVSGSSAVIYFWKDSWYVTYTAFTLDALKEITKFKIRKQGYTFTASYFNYVDNEWVVFEDYLNYDFDYDEPVFFEYSVEKLAGFPENTINITSASLIVEDTTTSGVAEWGIVPIDDDPVFSCLEYLTPEVLTDFGPILALDSLAIGREIQDFEFHYYNEGDGGGFVILDSNGDEVLGLATSSPEWMVNSINGWEIIKDSITLGNNSWYRVHVTFDWTTYTATIVWESTTGNDYLRHTVSLIKQTNVATFQIRSLVGRSWGPSYQKIKFDNVIVTPQSYWMQDWHPYNCLSGESFNEGYSYSWGFPANDPKPTLTLALGGTFNIDKFVLYHRPTSEETDWMNTDYTISYATSISGTFIPLVEVIGNTESEIEHNLDNTTECSFIKLEINSYTKPTIAPIMTVDGQDDSTDFVTIDGGFLREFEIWQAEDNDSINSQDHPVVCLDLRHQFNITGHGLVLYGEYPYQERWDNEEEFFQYSDDPGSSPNEVSFTPPDQASVPFFYPDEYLDTNGIGGPVVLTTSVFLSKGNYKIYWQIYGPDTPELVKMDIIGSSLYSVTTTIVSTGWVSQANTINLTESGYYAVQVSADSSALTGTWGVRNVSFENMQATSKWFAFRRITAENFTYDWRDPQAIEEEDRGVRPGIDKLKKVLVYTKDYLRPTECWWWWVSGLSVLENDVINTKEGFRSLKITYPDSDRPDYIRFLEGDTFGKDDQYSFKDSLSMWLYVSDINKLDVTEGGIAFGCFDGWQVPVTYDDIYSDDFDWVKIQRNVLSWDFIDMDLSTGWNQVKLRFDKYINTYPEQDPNTGVLDSVLNHRKHETSSFGMVFRGKGEGFHMFLDDIKIERNYFYDEVMYGDKGLCLTWGEFAELPLSGTSLRRGTIEMWLKLYTGTNGIDIYENVASRTIFTLINNSDECITLSLRGSHWFEIGIGNTKADFSSLYANSTEVDLSNFSFGIGDVLHAALVWSHDGTEMSNTNTLRLYINGVKCLSSNSTWDISDNKGTLLRLGGGNSYLSTNDNDDGSAIFSNVKIYNHCKEEFDLNERVPKIYDTVSSNAFLRLSGDDITFYASTSLELPMVFEAVQPGEKVKVYTKVDKTKPELYNQFTGTITVDWEVPV